MGISNCKYILNLRLFRNLEFYLWNFVKILSPSNDIFLKNGFYGLLHLIFLAGLPTRQNMQCLSSIFFIHANTCLFSFGRESFTWYSRYIFKLIVLVLGLQFIWVVIQNVVQENVGDSLFRRLICWVNLSIGLLNLQDFKSRRINALICWNYLISSSFLTCATFFLSSYFIDIYRHNLIHWNC